jgi:hypothetical protein
MLLLLEAVLSLLYVFSFLSSFLYITLVAITILRTLITATSSNNERKDIRLTKLTT